MKYLEHGIAFINEQYFFEWSAEFLDSTFDEFFYCEIN